MSLRLLVAGMLVLAALSSTSDASAQDDSARARVLFEQSAAAYRDGRFEAAAGMLEEAYRLDPAPILLYNLARARESSGDHERALEAFTQYLREDPETDKRRQVESRIRTLEELAERAQEEPPSEGSEENVDPDLETTEAEEADGGRPTWAPWLVAGLGAATLGAGLALGAMAQGRSDDAEAAANHVEGTALAGEADRLARTANVLFGVGGVVTLAGAIWGIAWMVGGDVDEDSALRVGPDGLTVRF